MLLVPIEQLAHIDQTLLWQTMPGGDHLYRGLPRPNELLVCRLAEAKTDGEVVVFAKGNIENSNGPPIVMDEEAARAIIARFDDQGVDVPVDWEHGTVTKGERGERAPAAGWITALTWDDARGLIAAVKWNDEALEDIRSRRYKYVSPVFQIDQETRRPNKLHSLALTNKPATKRQSELLAASESLYEETTDMAKKDEKVSLQDDGAGGGGSIAALAVALTKAGVEVDAGNEAGVIDAAIQWILSKVGEGAGEGAGEGEGGGDMEEAARELFKALGADSADEALIKFKAAYVSREEFTALSDKLKARDIDEALERYERANKINPQDDAQVKACRAFAERDLKGFITFMDSQPAIIEPGRKTPKEEAGTKRARLIKAAASEWHSTPTVNKHVKLRSYVDQSLRDEDLALLTDTEADEL